jgi:hypothetical protein
MNTQRIAPWQDQILEMERSEGESAPSFERSQQALVIAHGIGNVLVGPQILGRKAGQMGVTSGMASEDSVNDPILKAEALRLHAKALENLGLSQL